ncbi:MAG TPA: response regulator transcription factor [Blastocatellia bacterium]|nr:response regulator transcription factor [Blastocatellia bacterium]
MTSSQSPQVLVVDDNQAIRATVSDYLSGHGYSVLQASTGIQGLEVGLSASPDLIILDVVMPGMDGFRVCKLLRERNVQVPIIMLTERTHIDDKLAGFSQGADDYLGKPFSPLELELRIQALLRRAGRSPQHEEVTVLKLGGLEIDMERHTVTVDGNDVLLTPIEFSILKLLASSPGHVYSRNDLLSVIWDTNYEGYKRNIDPHVNRLRLKIEPNPKKPKYVLTVWGIGYKFNDSLAEAEDEPKD